MIDEMNGKPRFKINVMQLCYNSIRTLCTLNILLHCLQFCAQTSCRKFKKYINICANKSPPFFDTAILVNYFSISLVVLNYILLKII